MKKSSKKPYSAPQLNVHGDTDKITKELVGKDELKKIGVIGASITTGGPSLPVTDVPLCW